MSLRALIWVAVSTHAQTEDDRMSLPQQEADTVALAASKGWRVVDILRVPGHSRRYKDYNELTKAAAERGIDAFARLEQHWNDKDFDVLICRDGDRFARSQGLFGRIVEEVVESANASIWSLADGLIDKNNYRMWIAMVGYRAASDIDRLVKMRRDAMNRYAERGLPTTSSVVWSHRVVRDSIGRAVAIEPDPDKQRVLYDMATLIVEGNGWVAIGKLLKERFGHTRSNNEPFSDNWAYNIVHNPMFWGHSARYWRDSTTHNGTKTDMWVFDEAAPLPDGTMIFRNTHAPALTGEIAEAVKAELRRRRMSIRGSARPRRSKQFSGLCVCAGCSYLMVYHGNRGYPGYKCISHSRVSSQRPDCRQRRYIQDDKLQKYFDSRLQAALKKNEHIFPDEKQSLVELQRRIDLVKKEMHNAENKIRNLIQKQSNAPENTQSYYEQEIERVAEQLKLVEAQVKELEREKQAADTTQRDLAIEDIRRMGIEAFWRQSETKINQLLHRIVGNRRLLIRDGEIVDIGYAPPHKRKPRSHSGI